MVFGIKESQIILLACLLGQAMALIPSTSSLKDSASSIPAAGLSGTSSVSINTSNAGPAQASTLGTGSSPAPASLNTSSAGVTPPSPLSTNSSSAPASATGGIGSSGTLSGHSSCFNFLNQKDGCVSPTTTNNCHPKMTNITIEQFGSDGGAENPGTAAKASDPSLSMKSLPGLAPLDDKKLVARQTPGAAAPSLQASLATSNPTGSSKDASSLTGLAAGPGSSMTSSSQLKGTQAASNVGAGGLMSSNSVTANGICGQYNPDVDIGVCLWSGEDITGQDVTKSGWLSTALTTNCNKQVAVFRAGTPQPIVAKILDGCNFKITQPSLGCSQIYLTKKAFMSLNPSPEEVTSGYFKDSLMWDFLSRSNATNTPI